LLTPFAENLADFEKLESLIEKSIDIQNVTDRNEYKVNPQFSETLKLIDDRMKKVQDEIESLRKKESAILGLDIKMIQSATQTYLFESKKKESDEAFRKSSKCKNYKTVSIKNRLLSFTTADLQELVSEYNCILEEYMKEQQ